MPIYSWLPVFQQAEGESDATKLHARVMDAECAIFIRMQELSSLNGSDAEVKTETQEIRSALHSLLRIKTEKLKWPSVGLEQAATDTAS